MSENKRLVGKLILRTRICRGQKYWLRTQYDSETSAWIEPNIDRLSSSSIDLASISDLGRTTTIAGHPNNSCLMLQGNGVIVGENQTVCYNGEHETLCQYEGNIKQTNIYQIPEYAKVLLLACYTIRGHKCIFPFNFHNASHDGTKTQLTYTKCATSELHRPWCPTSIRKRIKKIVSYLSDSHIPPDIIGDEIVSWDYCLPTCPHDSIEPACLTDPQFPRFAQGNSQGLVNFSTTYELDVGDTVLDVSMISITASPTFHCLFAKLYKNISCKNFEDKSLDKLTR